MAKEVRVIKYQCISCGKIYSDEQSADVCCKQYYCQKCGVKTHQYINFCDDCSEEKKFERAVKMTVDEWNEKYPEYMVFHEEEYYINIHDFLESIRNGADDGFMCPGYIWGTEEFLIELDADEIIDTLEEYADIEDFEIGKAGREELEQYLIDWNNKYGRKGYTATGIAILIPEELKKKYPAAEDNEVEG